MRTWQPKIQFSVSLFLTKLWPWSLIKFINTLWKMFKKISLKLLSLSHYVKVWKISLKVFQNRSILMLLPSQKMRLLSPLIACHQLYNYKVWTWLDTHLNRRYVLQSYFQTIIAFKSIHESVMLNATIGFKSLPCSQLNLKSWNVSSVQFLVRLGHQGDMKVS